MTLTTGARIGPYEVAALIGEGGMGQVYRATDTRLKRPVALKILPPSVATDPDRLARFQREAEVLASLNHPHIASIYGLEQNEGVLALVMELVDGEDLSARIARGPLPLDEALPIATQVAEALEAAHEQGIVHRDLKPANIKLRADGTVKVLDFGLAKAMEPALSGLQSASLANSPTLTSPAVMTGAGIVLGTSAYMAPEQARGRAVDRRADIWAFGVVLYEMLVGRQMFQGEDVTEILASVVKEQPDLSAAPVQVRRVLEACLKKDRRQRLQAVGDWRLLLDDGASTNVAVVAAPRARWVPWLVAGIAAVLLAGLAFVHFREVTPEELSRWSTVPLPAGSPGWIELSPDGRKLLVRVIQDGKSRIYLRDLDSADWRPPLLTAENARHPTWSPDSRFVAFFADGQLKKIPAAGGPAQPLCSETGLGAGATWNANGVILFASESGPLRRVDASGGPCSVVEGGSLHSVARMPVFMPDGNHFFYVSRSPGDTSSSGTYLAALDDPRARKVLSDDSSVVYSPPLAAGSSAHLLFMRDEVMMAQPFDEAKLEPVGDPFTVAPRVSRTPTGPQIAASVAQGTLVYLSGQDVRSQLAWFDLSSGKKVSSVGSTANQQGVALSFDGRNALIRRFEQNAPTSLWVYDLVGGRENRPMPPGTSFGSGATWFSDGSRILFGGASGTSAARGLYARDLNSSGQPELISPLEAVNQAVPAGFSRDGRFLVYTVIDPKTQADIWYVAWGVKPDLKNAVKFAATDAIESQGQLSPNGRCMAFTSNARGAFDVYIRPFPDGPGERKVSPDGGQQPRWSDDGKQLYFLRTLTTFDRATLFASSVGVEDGCVLAGPPRELFQFNTRQIVPQANVFSYSPHPDGKRVLVNSLIDEGEPTINLITNWHKAIPERETR